MWLISFKIKNYVSGYGIKYDNALMLVKADNYKQAVEKIKNKYEELNLETSDFINQTIT